MTGWWKTESYVCLPCTEKNPESDGKREEKVYTITFIDEAVDDLDDLPPLQLGVNTVPPSGG